MWLIFFGFLIHIIFLGSIFDIYFKSPVIHGMTPHQSPLSPPAKRLVLFVADGLRSDTFFEKPEISPYLRSTLTERGAWGVSHTRVPTETRPGHVALIAGLYEDPSAIATGWQENPVEFDSVFNQSRETWAWGSPEVLPMFAKGASGQHVHTAFYSREEVDFSGKENTSLLDTWVFSRVKKLFEEAKENKELYERLHQDRIIFFLHLLGLDTAGHTHKPYSREYEENIRVVDRGVQEIERLLEAFYEYDNSTAFVFTSDHGMTDWGSHGAGDVSETDTPLIAWGAGVSGPKPVLHRRAPSSPSSWKLAQLVRRDVNQADIAPLMASLIGINVPVNNVGILPKEYLSVSKETLAEAVFANARQLAAQYTRKREMTEDGTLPWLYRPYPALLGAKELQLIEAIHSNMYRGSYREAISLSDILIRSTLSGLEYYEKYYQCVMLTCITLAFLGWVMWLLWSLLAVPTPDTGSPIWRGGIVLNLICLGIVCFSVYLIWVQNLPLQMYIYCLLPEVLWWRMVREYSFFLRALRRLKNCMGLQWPLGLGVLYFLGVEILVLTFFYRPALSGALLIMAFWPLFFCPNLPKLLVLAWAGSCGMIAVFPLLPVVGKEANSSLVQLSALLWLLFIAMTLIVSNSQQLKSRVLRVLFFQIFLLLLVVWNVYSIETSFKDKQGLPLLNQILSWTMLGVSLFLPLLGTTKMLMRLLTIAFSLAVPFLLLSASHEGLFLLALTLHVLCWLVFESYVCDSSSHLSEITFEPEASKKEHRRQHAVTACDFRRAYFFLVYVILSFFGTGNVASINSFDPTWVRCFVTVFSPFLMTTLILWKTVIPFLIVTCVFRAQNVMIQAPTEKLFLIVLVFSDLMGVHFLHLVTNKGSWLDIGTSISHYVIIETTTLFLLLLYGVAKIYTGYLLPWLERPKWKPLVAQYKSLEAGDSKEVSNYLLDTGFTFAGQSSTFRRRHFE